MMKRILSALLVLCMLCALLPMGLSAVQAYSRTGVAYPVEGGNIYFDKETGTITGCDESVTTADIPAEIDGVVVTSIGWRAFSQCSNLTSVTISEGITSIDGWAFESCSSLTSITIPGSVTSIDDFAFAECSALMGIWVDESNLYYCSDEFGALYNKDRTTLLRVPVTISGEYAIADGVNSIGNQAFQHCSSMTSVTIPESVTSIGIQAFQHCSSMTSVTIPESVTSIEEDAFNDCSALTGIWVADSNLYYCNDESGILFNKDKTELLQTPEMISGQYTIPDGVLRLSDYAFYNCVHLTSVVIPDSVTSMGVFAFFHCISLKAACFKGDAPDIGDEETFVFLTYDEEGNPYDDIPGLTIYYIEGKAGWPWNRPTATWDGVNVPEPFVDEVTYPVEGGNLYFRKSTGEIYGCDASVTNAVIPAEIHGVVVTSIGDSAFGHCTGLTSITIPDSVTSIGNSAFYGCTGLTSIKVSDGNTRYDSRNDCNAIIETATNTLIFGCKNTRIPDSVTSIGNYAFEGCTGLTSITIPDSVTSIGNDAFSWCTGLTSITIPSGVTTIPRSAFYSCKSLHAVFLPSSISCIEPRAFVNCTALTGVFFAGDAPTEENAFKVDTVGGYINPPDLTLYYIEGKDGWTTPTWNGYPTAIWNPDGHTHSYTDAVTAPTCTERGYTTHTCECGYSYVDAYADALGHDWSDWTVTTAPTCTEKGEETRVCSRCNEDETREVAALGHDLISHEAKAPTCTEIGWNAYDTCSRCDYTTYKEIPALGHDWSDWAVTTAPTCTEKGAEKRTCSRCNEDETREVAVLGHDLIHHDAKAPTCTEIGWNAYDTCSRCDYTTYEELPALGHNPGTAKKENNVEPTCTEAGGYDMVIRCTRCNEILESTHTDVPALGHDWSDWTVTTAPTCTEKGVETRICSRCNEAETREVAALGHEWNAPKYVWSNDYSKVTASRTCKHNNSHVETETVQTTCEVTVAATVHSTGEIMYTAVFQNSAFTTQTKTVVLPKLDKPGLPCDGGDTCPGIIFTDMPPKGDWAHDAIDWAVVTGITNGTGATTFSPNQGCTRGQVVTFLWRAAGSPEPSKTDNPFKDVKEGAFYYKAVLWAVENGITNGTGATTFSPNETCTRAQIVTFLWRYKGSPEPKNNMSPFTDVTGDYYYKAVLWAVENKVTNGTSAHKFAPNNTCTRAQIVTFLYRDMVQ